MLNTVIGSNVNQAAYLNLIAIHLLRSKEVISRSFELLKPEIFNRAGEKKYRLLWTWSTWYYARYGEVIPQNIFYTQVTGSLTGDPTYFDQSEWIDFWELVEMAYQYPDNQLASDYTVGLVQELLNERVVKEAAESIQVAQDTPELMKRLDALSEAMARTRLVGNEPVSDLYVPGKAKIKYEVRTPTGVDFFDLLIGGGVKAGDVIGVLGPSGGGKTTLAVMLACSFARLRREYVGYFSYEDEYFDEISRRTYGYMGGIPRSILHGLHDIKQLPASYASALDMALAEYGEYLLPFDMVRDSSKGVGGGGATELEIALRLSAEKGKPCRLVIIDQLQPMVMRYMGQKNQDPEKMRFVMSAMIPALKRIAQAGRMNCAVILFHQLATAFQSGNPTRKMSRAQGSEYRAFDQFVQACLNLGVTDDKNRSWLSATKARDAKLTDLIIQHNHEYYRIEYYPDRFQVAGKRFIEKSENSQPVEVEGAHASSVDRGGSYDRDDKEL